MTSFLLIQELQQRLGDELKNWHLEHFISGENHRAAPNIIIGQLPPRTGSMPANATQLQKNSSNDFIPFIIIRPLDNTFSNDHPCQQILNIAIVCGIRSSDSYEKYERGVGDVLNLIDKIALSIKKYQLWGQNNFYHNDDIKCTYGSPKSIDPYEIGLQAEAPYFYAVALTSFTRTIATQKVELNNVFKKLN